MSTPGGETTRTSATAPRAPAVWRGVVAFAPMCAIAALSWAELVKEPPVGRLLALIGLAIGCGLVLALTARLEPDGRAEARIVRVVTLAIALLLGPVAAGVPPELLAPTGWPELLDRLAGGVDGLPTTWPYEGGDMWVRTTVLLAIPVMTIPAAAFALWPPADGPGGREAAAVRRVGALLLLLSLVGFAGSERELADPIGRGALLLVALVAWLFLPRLETRPTAAFAAGVAVLAAALVSLPLAATLAPGRAVIDGFAGDPQRSQSPAGSGGQGDRPLPRSERREREERRSEGGTRRDPPERPKPPERQRPPERPNPPNPDDAQPGSPIVLIVVLAALAAGIFLLRRRLLGARAADEAEELRRALQRLGWSVPPKTTLAELEATLDAGAGPGAARYARGLRERRFGVPEKGSSGGLDRRALRTALTAGHGPRVHLLALLALPPDALLAPRR